jgi:hypothetical protein
MLFKLFFNVLKLVILGLNLVEKKPSFMIWSHFPFVDDATLVVTEVCLVPTGFS